MTKASLKSIFSLLLTASAVMAGCTSCSDNSGIDGPVEIQFWDIVTYDRTADLSTFTFRQVDDSPEVRLTSATRLPDEIENGTRMVIRYIPESGKAYTSGPVKLLSASKITQSPVATEWKDVFDNWDRDKVFLYSAWRTGTYLNFHVRLTYDTEPRIFQLAADPATLESEYPDVYLIHIMAQPTDYHDRAYFASFDIAELWQKPEVKGIKLHVANTNLEECEFTFLKKH